MTDTTLSEAAAAMGRVGGRSRSERKLKAVRENAKKGGRPRKVYRRNELTGWTDERYAWPHGAAAIAKWRAAVRNGQATETTDACEGCASHQHGTRVPVFEWLGE